MTDDILDVARRQVLADGRGLGEAQVLACLRLPDDRLAAPLALAPEARVRGCGPAVGLLGPAQAGRLAALGVHRYNHNLETARSFFGHVVTTHSWQERHATCQLVRSAGMELCCGGIVGLGESTAQRAELAAQLAALGPHEVPLNFLNPRPGTPLAGRPRVSGPDALRTIGAFRLALPGPGPRYPRRRRPDPRRPRPPAG